MKQPSLLLIWLALSIGDLVYALASGNYGSVVERSIFQGSALLTVWLCVQISRTTHD